MSSTINKWKQNIDNKHEHEVLCYVTSNVSTLQMFTKQIENIAQRLNNHVRKKRLNQIIGINFHFKQYYSCMLSHILVWENWSARESHRAVVNITDKP